MHLTVQPDGSVSDAKVESGHALLATAALQAARQWRFEPAPETTDQTIDINFADVH
jgi:TonB family protein